MNVRAVCEGGFTLPLPVADAVALFTPEGERRWAGADWDPVYPIPGADDTEPGTVDVTCTPVEAGTQVRVTYDVTSLGPEGAAFVRELESGYAAFMDAWRGEILEGVA